MKRDKEYMIRTYLNNSIDLIKWRKYNCNITFKSSKYKHDIYIDDLRDPNQISTKSEFIEEEIESLQDEIKNSPIISVKSEFIEEEIEILKDEVKQPQLHIINKAIEVKNYYNIKLEYINKPRIKEISNLFCFKVLSNNEIFEKNQTGDRVFGSVIEFFIILKSKIQ